MTGFINTNQDPECAGIGCTKSGKHHLEIVLIKKSAWFCDSCKKELENNSLILNETSISLGIAGSEDKGGRIQ